MREVVAGQGGDALDSVLAALETAEAARGGLEEKEGVGRGSMSKRLVFIMTLSSLR